MQIELDAERDLRPVSENDLDELWALIAANRDHLARWMPWAIEPRREETAAFVRDSLRQAARNDGFHAAIRQGGAIVGIVGFHHVNRRDLQTSIGYWLAADAQGRGTMTLAVRALVDHAIGPWGLHRVEIRAAVENARSRAVPERLGFVAEGVLRDCERLGDRYVDLVVYSMLAADWRASR